MSIPSGAGSASQSQKIQLATLMENTEVASEETKKQEKKEKAGRIDTAQAAQFSDTGKSGAAGSEIQVRPYELPAVHSETKPDFDRAEQFLMSSEHQAAAQTIEEVKIFTTQVLTKGALITIGIKEAASEQRNAASVTSASLSDLSGKITKALGERMIQKGNETFSASVAGATVGLAMAAGSAGVGASASAKMRTETKAFHKNMNDSRAGTLEQKDMLRNMESEGLRGTKAFNDAQKRLDLRQEQESKLTQSHENHSQKMQQVQQTAFATQAMGQSLGGIVSAGSHITEATGQAEVDSMQHIRDVDREMKDRANQASQQAVENLNDALRTLRDLQEASNSVIGAVARNIK
ncbi:MAG: hypothetical protein ACRC1U_06350 [Vibrionaceae bacterium]